MGNKKSWKELAVILIACATIAALDKLLIVIYGHSFISELWTR